MSDARTPLKLNGKQQQQTTTTTTTLRIKLLPTTIPLPYQPSPLSKKKERKGKKRKKESYYIIPRKRKFLGKKRREHRLKSDSILATERALLLPFSSSQRGLNVTAVHGRRRRRTAKKEGRGGSFCLSRHINTELIKTAELIEFL